MLKNTPTAIQPPKLLDTVREKIRVKHYSIRTETQYLQWVKRYILFHNKRHPREMGGKEVEAFLSHRGRSCSRLQGETDHSRVPRASQWQVGWRGQRPTMQSAATFQRQAFCDAQRKVGILF